MKTIFNTPVLSHLFHLGSKLILHLAGWRVDGSLPNLPKYIIIGAPHTSNWDFILFMGAMFCLKTNVRFIGKAELFKKPIGWFFRWSGGIPVDRSKSSGLVEQMVDACNQSEKFILTIAPEGTRHGVKEWKSGFYHIAKGAGIPIVMAKVDGKHKAMRVGETFYPTDDMEADMKAIKDAFKGLVGINPPKKYIPLED